MEEISPLQSNSPNLDFLKFLEMKNLIVQNVIIKSIYKELYQIKSIKNPTVETVGF